MHSCTPDQNYWLGPNSRFYHLERRSGADGLVMRGLARWVEIEDKNAALATHRLISLALPASLGAS